LFPKLRKKFSITQSDFAELYVITIGLDTTEETKDPDQINRTKVIACLKADDKMKGEE
jgi:hypothetical protein